MGNLKTGDYDFGGKEVRSLKEKQIEEEVPHFVEGETEPSSEVTLQLEEGDLEEGRDIGGRERAEDREGVIELLRIKRSGLSDSPQLKGSRVELVEPHYERRTGPVVVPTV